MNAPENLNLLPATARFAIAIVVAILLALAWTTAKHESHDAVVVAGHNIASQVTHITLPPVEVVGRRTTGKTAA